MPCVLVLFPKPESVSLATTKMTVILVVPESGLVQEENLMSPTAVETRLLQTHQTTAQRVLKPWDIFWYTDKKNKRLLNKHP